MHTVESIAIRRATDAVRSPVPRRPWLALCLLAACSAAHLAAPAVAPAVEPAGEPASAVDAGAAARRYVTLRGAGVRVRDARLSDRALSVRVRSRRVARLTFAIVSGGRTLTRGRRTLVVRRARTGRTFTAQVRRAVRTGPVRLRVTARAGRRWGRGTVALTLRPPCEAVPACVADRRGPLHLLEPLGYAGFDAAAADGTLVGHLRVTVCRVSGDTCAQVGEAVPSLRGDGAPVYELRWPAGAYGAEPGEVVRLTVRVAGLSIGSRSLRLDAAGTSAGRGRLPVGRATRFGFWIGWDPAVRVRSLHAAGRPPAAVARELRDRFRLGDAAAAQTLYDDLRTGDVLAEGGEPYGAQDLALALASPDGYGAAAPRVAALLATHWPAAEVLDAVVRSAFPALDAGGALAVVRDGLGVTELQPAATLLAGATPAGGVPAFTPGQVLAAVRAIKPLSTEESLALLLGAGYTLEHAAGGLAAVGTTPASVAAALIRRDGLEADARNAALRAAFGVTAGAARTALVNATANLVAMSCADLRATPSAADVFRRAPATTGEVATALATRCGSDATGIARVLSMPPYAIPPMYAVMALHGAGFTPWGPHGVAYALKNAYGLPAVEAARAFTAAASYREDHFAGGIGQAYFGLTRYPGVTQQIEDQLNAVFRAIGRGAPLVAVTHDDITEIIWVQLDGKPVVTCEATAKPPANGSVGLVYHTACLNIEMQLLLANLSGISVEQLPAMIEFQIPDTAFVNTPQQAPLGEQCEPTLTRLKKGGITGVLDFLSNPGGYATCYGQRTGSPAGLQPVDPRSTMLIVVVRYG